MEYSIQLIQYLRLIDYLHNLQDCHRLIRNTF